MFCEIEWNGLNLAQWQDKFASIRRANLLQSYEYARVLCMLNRQTARWGLIKINAQEAGLVQMIESKALGGFLHAAIIDRGPLWFTGFGHQNHILAFSEAFNRQYPKRFGRARRFIPEYTEIKTDIPGFKKTKALPYQTIWVDLESEISKSKLKTNWRRSLNKAEKAALEIEWDETGQTFNTHLQGYIKDQAQKSYKGPSVRLLSELVASFAKEGKILIGHAKKNNKICASILILCHGRSATYQTGWSDDYGRQFCAHHLLFWDAMHKLKGNGIVDFDLGGVNDQTAKGIKDFKSGLGGELVTMCGFYV